MSDPVGKLQVEDHWVGIVGLEGILLRMSGLALDDESRMRRALLEEVRKKNYVPPAAEQRYMDALFRELQRVRGEPVEEPTPSGLVIEIVGPGCPSCDELEQQVIKTLSKLNLPADVRHVRGSNHAARSAPGERRSSDPAVDAEMLEEILA